MYIGTVVGHVWASKKLDNLPPKSLLEVELEEGGGRIVAIDPLCCGEGEQVLVTTGSAASCALDGACVDALIVASLEQSAG